MLMASLKLSETSKNLSEKLIQRHPKQLTRKREKVQHTKKEWYSDIENRRKRIKTELKTARILGKYLRSSIQPNKENSYQVRIEILAVTNIMKNKVCVKSWKTKYKVIALELETKEKKKKLEIDRQKTTRISICKNKARKKAKAKRTLGYRVRISNKARWHIRLTLTIITNPTRTQTKRKTLSQTSITLHVQIKGCRFPQTIRCIWPILDSLI